MPLFLVLAAALACPPLTPQTVSFFYYNPPHNCTPIASACNANEPMVFRATGPFDAACGPYSFAWTFSDGTFLTGVQVTKTFAERGVHSVTLAVGGAQQSTRVTSIIGIGVHPFGLISSPLPNNGAAPSTFRFEALPYGDADYGDWTWNLGDGTILTTRDLTIVHTYRKSGTYVVTLTAANAVPTEVVRVTATATGKRRAAGH